MCIMCSMPYVDNETKRKFMNDNELGNAGTLNFAINQLVADYMEQNKFCYQTLNDVVGAMECAKMELYRRIAAPYEDEKIGTNGDVRPYMNINDIKANKY